MRMMKYMFDQHTICYAAGWKNIDLIVFNMLIDLYIN